MSLLAFGVPGIGELVLILLIVLIVFGAGKLPHPGQDPPQYRNVQTVAAVCD